MLRRLSFVGLALLVLAALTALAFPEPASAQTVSLSVNPITTKAMKQGIRKAPPGSET